MKNNIFMPKELTVGFQSGRDTYTGRLAYVIYKDEKGVLRKEKSWNSWRNKDVEPLITENIPTEGLVLNKKAGGYSSGWNHRQTYVRVYDPRGFEFEISVPNLLYILENTNSIKGKGLEGKFVYGWDGTELILMPTSSPDYVEITEFNKLLHDSKNIKVKDLVIGATYKTKQNQTFIYMGSFEYYGWKSNGTKYHWFYNVDSDSFEQMKTVSQKLIDVIDNNCCEDYADLFYKMEGRESYSPVDRSKDEYIEYTLEEFKNAHEESYWKHFYSNSKDITISKAREDKYVAKFVGEYINEEYEKIAWGGRIVNDTRRVERKLEYSSLEKLYEDLKPCYRNEYLKNGRFHREGK